MDTKVEVTLTAKSQELFVKLAKDAANWAGNTMIDISPAERGNLTDLKKNGLLTTFDSDGFNFADFTDKGRSFAKQLGIDIDWTAKDYDTIMASGAQDRAAKAEPEKAEVETARDEAYDIGEAAGAATAFVLAEMNTKRAVEKAYQRGYAQAIANQGGVRPEVVKDMKAALEEIIKRYENSGSKEPASVDLWTVANAVMKKVQGA